MVGHAVQPEVQHLLRRIGDGEQRARGLVHAFVGGLRGQRDRYDQRIGVDMLKLAFWLGRFGLKTRKYRAGWNG